MANKRISALDNLGATPATADILPITDKDDLTGSPQGTTKGVTFGDLTNHLATQVSLGNHESLTSAVHGISAFGATLVDDADASAARTTLGLGTAATTASTDYATAAQGTLADSATQPADNISTLTNDSGYITGVTAGELGDFDFDDNAILGFKASLPTEITAATYTVADSDNGQVLRVNHATGCTVTIPSGLLSTDSTGFNCSFIQVGAGQITFDNDGTSVINNRQSHTKTNAQWAAASVVSTANNVFVLAGDTAS